MLSVFLFLKLGLVHAFSHAIADHDTHECEECVFIVKANENQSLDDVTPSYSVKEDLEELELAPNYLSYQNPSIKELLHQNFFNKPPPFLQ